MTIKSLSLSATCRLESFCKNAGIRYTSELTDEPSEIRLYDFWIDDVFVNLNINRDRVYFYTHDYDCTIYRNEFHCIEVI